MAPSERQFLGLPSSAGLTSISVAAASIEQIPSSRVLNLSRLLVWAAARIRTFRIVEGSLNRGQWGNSR